MTFETDLSFLYWYVQAIFTNTDFFVVKQCMILAFEFLELWFLAFFSSHNTAIMVLDLCISFVQTNFDVVLQQEIYSMGVLKLVALFVVYSVHWAYFIVHHLPT